MNMGMVHSIIRSIRYQTLLALQHQTLHGKTIGFLCLNSGSSVFQVFLKKIKMYCHHTLPGNFFFFQLKHSKNARWHYQVQQLVKACILFAGSAFRDENKPVCYIGALYGDTSQLEHRSVDDASRWPRAGLYSINGHFFI